MFLRDANKALPTIGRLCFNGPIMQTPLNATHLRVCQEQNDHRALAEERATYTGQIHARFAFLEAVGFRLETLALSWPESTNFDCLYAGDDLFIMIRRKMGQTRVALSADRQEWLEKDDLLEQIGIPKKRHPATDLGHWTGYRLSTQAKDLQDHLDLLLTHFLQR